MNERLIDIRSLISKMDLDNSGFLNFFDLKHLQAGILRLKPGERDTQEPHSDDELYYVIKGSGWMELGRKKVRVKEGSIVFVPSGLHHKFYGNKDDLVVLYVFAA